MISDQEFRTLYQKAKDDDKESIEKIVNMFKPMIKKHSVIDGKLDEDCFQELTIKLMKCIKSFKYDEEGVENKLLNNKG